MKFTPKQREALRVVAEGKFYPVLTREEDGWYARWRASEDPAGLGIDGWVDEYVRRATVTRLTEDAEHQKHETLHDAWMMALKSETGLVVWDDAECATFAAELTDWAGNAAEDVDSRKSLLFRFAADDSGFFVRVNSPKGRRRLRALGQATFVWGSLRDLKRADADTLSVTLSRSEAEDFLAHGANALKDSGYSVEGLPPTARITAEAEFEEASDSSRDAKPNAGRLSLVVRVDGEVVSAEEIRFLLEQGSSLVFFRNRWIEVNRNILKAALRALEKGVGQKPNLISFAMGLGHVGDLEIENLKAHGWLRGLVNSLKSPPSTVTSDLPLRPYQQKGVSWLKFLTDHGFGALLADDMGLGKTVQTIAWIRAEKTRETPVLVLAPLTLLANWRRELQSFAPELSVHVHHGESRHLEYGFRRMAAETDVVLTSYNLLVKDYSIISKIAWSALVLDEAQAIKNPDTQAARAVKSLLPPKRIALTGTPIENSVRDIWAIEDFLNPGFLGDKASFLERFVRPLARDPLSAVGKRLSHALEPFVLRRLKTDPEIAVEIGEKREIREYCRLGAEERRAYETALSAFRVSDHAAGDVFALLTELKLICDGQVEREAALIASDCGKLTHLVDLLESIFAAGESALVFTQYAQIGARLKRALEERFARRMPFLYGALSPSAREAEIRRFNRPGPSAFILSLKAGGFGLNLTKATHVIHYDRWWNPAVENQATDRAHRIGQEKDVFVHLMIAEGTIEERVDELLARKSSLKTLLADGRAFWEAAKLT